MTRTLAFQSIASVALPSLIIHQAVHATQKALAGSSARALRLGPVAVGFAILPLLPYVDEPVEEIIFHVFDMVRPQCSPAAATVITLHVRRLPSSPRHGIMIRLTPPLLQVWPGADGDHGHGGHGSGGGDGHATPP